MLNTVFCVEERMLSAYTCMCYLLSIVKAWCALIQNPLMTQDHKVDYYHLQLLIFGIVALLQDLPCAYTESQKAGRAASSCHHRASISDNIRVKESS